MIETGGAVICVIDDDRAVLDSTVALLESFGYTVRPFASADDFLRRPGSENADCLLLDLNMPGMNGLELLELMRSRRITAPAILLTANGERFGARATRAGVLQVLRKPVSEADLLQGIEAALKSRETP